MTRYSPFHAALGIGLILAFAFTLSIPTLTAQDTKKKKQPPPKKKREPLVIPDVPRDKVICFCLYTVHNKILKLTAQLYPLKKGEERKVILEVDRGDGWKKIATGDVEEEAWMTTFRVEKWDDAKSAKYRVSHAGGTKYEGIIRKNPVDQDVIVVGNLSCNSNTNRGPRDDIVANLRAQDPDLLFFAGDQSYDHKEHYAAWLLFGRQFGEIIKDRPTVTIPDDHDVGHPNLWGAAGKQAFRTDGADGGYYMPVKYVNMVQRAQTSHLPDPYDPTPVLRGITVYYTSLNIGGIDFAILEDRKWKTGPDGFIPKMGPRPDHITEKFDPFKVDLPEAELLGDRQLKFLHTWGRNWSGVTMKAVLSQTPFAGAAHLHGNIKNRLIADLDCNGWPQSGRNAALREIRRCYAFHLCGDQHLSTALHHGINDWEDAGWSFCSPSIWNLYGRWWWPLEKPEAGSPPAAGAKGKDKKSPLPYVGRYHDGLGNKLTMHAYANPAPGNFQATGYGLVRFRKSTREITMECWPRFVNVTQPEAKMYEGWPITIKQQDNYGRKALVWLPELNFTGGKDPVVQVVDEINNEVVYSIRTLGTSFRPKVFRRGTYTLQIGEPSKQIVIRGVKSEDEKPATRMKIKLN